jgi:hypothetical protein
MNPATDINGEAQWARHSKTRIFFAVIINSMRLANIQLKVQQQQAGV